MSNSFLIIKMSSLGDVIQSYYAAAYLKERNPRHRITWLVEERFKDLVDSYSCVDEVLFIDTKKIRKNLFRYLKEIVTFIKQLRRSKYDAVFDLQGNTKSAIFTLFSRSKVKVGFSKSCVSEWPNLAVTNHKIKINQKNNISLQYLNVLRQFFNDSSIGIPKHNKLTVDPKQKTIIECFLQQNSLKSKHLLMICPNSNWDNKKLPKRHLLEFLRGIDERLDVSFIFIYGDQKEKNDCNSYRKLFERNASVIGALQLPIWYFLMTKVSCVISMDSSALHLAAIADVPTFSIFGPSSSKIYGPSGAKHSSTQGSCPYGMKFEKRCSKLRSCPNAPCISKFSPQNLTDSFLKFFLNVSKDQPAQLANQNQYETQQEK